MSNFFSPKGYDSPVGKELENDNKNITISDVNAALAQHNSSATATTDSSVYNQYDASDFENLDDMDEPDIEAMNNNMIENAGGYNEVDAQQIVQEQQEDCSPLQTEAPQAETPQTETAQAETAQAETAQTETAQAETAQAETAQAETSQAETPQAETPQAETPQTETAQAETAQAETSQAETPQTETAQAETAQAETSQAETPQTETAQAETAQAETAQAETAQTETAQAETAQAETAQAETAQTETPQAETPQTETPQAETPQTETPQAETSQLQEEHPTEFLSTDEYKKPPIPTVNLSKKASSKSNTQHTEEKAQTETIENKSDEDDSENISIVEIIKLFLLPIKKLIRTDNLVLKGDFQFLSLDFLYTILLGGLLIVFLNIYFSSTHLISTISFLLICLFISLSLTRDKNVHKLNFKQILQNGLLLNKKEPKESRLLVLFGLVTIAIIYIFNLPSLFLFFALCLLIFVISKYHAWFTLFSGLTIFFLSLSTRYVVQWDNTGNDLRPMYVTQASFHIKENALLSPTIELIEDEKEFRVKGSVVVNNVRFDYLYLIKLEVTPYLLNTLKLAKCVNGKMKSCEDIYQLSDKYGFKTITFDLKGNHYNIDNLSDYWFYSRGVLDTYLEKQTQKLLVNFTLPFSAQLYMESLPKQILDNMNQDNTLNYLGGAEVKIQLIQFTPLTK